MFTGIVAAIGSIRQVSPLGEDGVRLDVAAGELDMSDVAIGDSIAIQGACMTVVEKTADGFAVDVSAESLRRTTGLAATGPVNLEKAMRLSDRVGGHLVSGHVDGLGVVRRFEPVGESHLLEILAPQALAGFLVYKGSITVDGVSLTVNHVEDLPLAKAVDPAWPEAARAGAPLPVREPHSLHAYFLRGGRLKEPIEFHVERLHDGRSFSQRRTTAVQDGEVLLAMISSYQLPQEGEDVQIPPPVVPPPEDLPSAVEIFRSVNHPAARFLGRTAAFDVRHVQGGIYLRPDAVRRDRQQLWLRARGKVPDSATQTVHRALLTYVCDQVMLEPALRSRGLSWRTRGMSLATLDHAQWFHRDVDANDWLLVVQDSPTSQGGRAMGRARVYDRAGRLLSTIGQEGMVRVPGAGQDVGGRWQVRVDAQDPQDAQAG